MNQDARIAELQDYLKYHYGKCKINRGRESIRIFYGNKRFYEMLKSSLPNYTNHGILELLK